jgi:hypothetical protein
MPAFMPNFSNSTTISWFPITPALLAEDYNGVSVIVDDVLRAVNVTASSG